MDKKFLKRISLRKLTGFVMALGIIVNLMPIPAYGIISDNTPPTIVSASRKSNTEIVVTFSESCKNLTQANDGGFTVKETGGTAAYTVSATAQGDDTSHVVLTVADLSASRDNGVTVTYTKGTNGIIADIRGNALESNSTGVTVSPWDGVPPTLVSASRTSSTSITVALSEDCRNLTQANDGGFTVKEKGGTAEYTVSATAQGDDTGHVVLTVADMSESSSKGVTVTYTKGTNGTIADEAGNPLETDNAGVSISPWDSNVPTVEITTTAPNPTYTRSIPLTITFSEAVTGFTKDDIVVFNATKNDNFSGSGSVYRITLTAVADGEEITVNIPAGAAKDSADNDSAAAEQLKIVYAATVDYAVDGGYITFAPSTGTVAGFKGNPGAIEIPEKINGVAVTSLGQNAFFYCTSMTSVTIPDSITFIGQSVFYGCTGLTSITIPDSVTAINQSTFFNCTGLREITFPNGLTEIKDQSFNGCSSLEELTFPNTLELIRWGAFLNCTGLKSITIPESVTSLGDNAFKNCRSLAAVYMKGNAPTYGDDVFLSTAPGITVYYRDGATGFSGTYAGCPTALWEQHTVTVSCGEHGTVLPETLSVYYGDNVTFTITPDTGFQISTLTYNGKNVTADAGGKYLSPAVTDAAILAVTFEAAGTPTAMITTSANNPTKTAPIPVTITFSAAVTGFELSDIGVTGGTAGNFKTTSASVYTADITPSGEGTVTVNVAANAAQGGGIGSRAAEPLSVVYDETAPSLSNADAGQITGSEATLSFTSSEAGTYYYLVYPAADTDPSSDTVKAQGNEAAAKGTGTAASGANSAEVTGLSATTDYKIYVVVEDAAGNISDVYMVALTTTIIKIQLTSSVSSFTNGATYTIKDAEQFERLAILVMGGNTGAGATFELLNGISFGYWQDKDGDGVVDDGEIFDASSGGSAYTKSNYVPIGMGGHKFSGVFDGKGHTVSGIYCSETNLDVGLFGGVYGGTVKNISVANSFFDTSASTSDSSAGIVSYLADGSLVENCSVDSSVTIKGERNTAGIAGSCRGSTIRGCYNGAPVTAITGDVGGIAGYVDGVSLIEGCWNSGSVSAKSNAGGIAGRTITVGDKLQNCCNTGAVTVISGIAGGIAGIGMTVENCYSAAAVSGALSTGAILGSLFGTGSAKGCYYDKQVCALKGIKGSDTLGSAEGKTTAEMQSGTAFAGWDTTVWHFSSGSYPKLSAFISADAAAPTLVSAKILSVTSIKVMLSEDCHLLTKANDGGFTVKEAGGTAVYSVTATAQGDNPREIVLTVDNLSASCKKGVIVTYTQGVNGTIADLAGNPLASDGSGVTAASPETVPPTMSSAVYVNDTQITVTLSEDCLEMTNPNDGGFTVKETGVTTTYTVTSTVRESSNKITLYVSDMSASCAKGVTVTYTKGGNGIITDLMGNDMETDGIGVAISAWDTGKPVISGAADGAHYNKDVAAAFASGTATLAKDAGMAGAYLSGTAISAEGDYVLTVTNAAGSTVISFTIDKTSPVLSGLSRISVTSAGAELQFTSSENTPYYFLILPAEDSEPDADAVRNAGPGAGWSGTASAGTDSVNVSGLIAGTDYTAYLILEDAAGNRSAMQTVNLTTRDTVIPLDASVTTLQSGVTYTIDSTDQLNRLGYLVQTGQSGAGATFILTEDIVFGYWQDNDTDGIVDNNEIYDAESDGTTFSNENFTVIGKSVKGFSGTFDGRGHTVSGLYTKDKNTSSNLNLSALIGYVDGGIVRNVGVKNSYIQGYKYPAGIVGHIKNGTVENCYTDDSVTIMGPGIEIGGVVGSCESSVIAFCSSRGSVRGEGFVTHLGGVVGQVIGENSAVRCCYNTGNVYAENNRHGTGGIAGVLGTGFGNRIENCFNVGSVTGSGDMFGGIAGSSYGLILNCYNAGAVSGTSYIGSIIGSRSYREGCVTTGCYYDSGVCSAGGICGSDSEGSAEGKSTAWMKSGAAYSGWDAENWSFASERYPMLIGLTEFTDMTSPTILSAVRTSDTEIVLTLSEDCRYLTKTSDGGFSVTEKDGTKTYAVMATVKGTDAQHIVLTLEDMAASGAKGITVTYAKGKTGTIADLAYNPLKTDGTGVAISAWDTAGPEVQGVTDKAFYKTSVKPTFTEGTATLKKDDGTAETYTCGTSDPPITAEGKYVLTVTDAAGNKTEIKFTIDTTAPTVSGLTDGAAYNSSVTPTFTEGTATLKKDGGTAEAYSSGTSISAEGSYVLTITDAAGNEAVINFTIDTTAPTLSDVSADTETGTGATLRFSSGEACSYYYIVLPADNTAPDAETVRAQGYGPEALGKGDAAAGPNSLEMTGLVAEKNYKVYVITEDAAGNLSELKAASFTTADNEIALETSVTTLEAGKTYTIGSMEQLNHLADLVNGGQTGAGSTFVLTADIVFGYWQDKDADGVVDDGEIFDAKSGGAAYMATNYDMIGLMDGDTIYSFGGTFDGRGHTVSGLYNNTSDPGAWYSTLFACVDGGTVRNVGVAESYIQGGISVSALVGDCINGTVENCWTDDSVSIVGFNSSIGGVVGYCSASTVQFCYNKGSVSGTGEANMIGGVMGYVGYDYSNGKKSIVQSCWNTGSVAGEDGYDYYSDGNHSLDIGGVAGLIYDEGSGIILRNCYNVGSVSGIGRYTGGVVGENWGTVQCCYNAGTVNGADYTGGVAGDNFGTVTGCYYDSDICTVDGINGSDVTNSAEGKITADMKTSIPFTSWNTDVWYFESGTYPKLVGALKFDVTPPTVTIDSESTDPTNDSPITVTITFSEDVSGFTADDITVENGTKGTLTGSGKSYTIDITPSADGAVTVDIAAGAAADAAGNVSTAATQLTRTYDGTAPTAPTVTSTKDLTADSTPTWTWTAENEENGTFRYKLDNSDLTSGTTEISTASYTPTDALSDGDHTLYVQERDAAGNWSDSGSYKVTVDTTAPTAGDTGTIAPKDISWNSVKLSWKAASDTNTAQADLLYKVVRSEKDLTTVKEANENGTLVTDWTVNLNSITVTGLTGPKSYYFNIIVKDAAGNEAVYTPVSVTTAAPPDDDILRSEVKVYVNGEEQSAGILTTTTTGDKTVSTITVNDRKLARLLDEKGNGAVVTIPIETDSDVAAGILTGKTVKNMEDKEAILVVKTDSSTYTLPASEIDIDAISEQLGEDVALSDIKVTVSISEPPDEMTKVIENAAEYGGFTIAVPAVEYSITCEYGGRTVKVDSFNAYVERTIAIPDGVDPSKITTGIVVDPDGTVHHVPTRITVIDGKYYAVINSLTNSAYSVIWNPVEFTDVQNHWAKDSVNNMGSRMVVSGVGNSIYEPDRDITRAEFATIIVRALGLDPSKGASCFDDVNENDWFCGYIKAASEYGLINGYGAGIFGPNDKITREQAMTIIARAMKITGLKSSMTAVDVESLLSEFVDGGLISAYAKEGIAACVNSGVVKGRSVNTIAPTDSITRAETAVIVERLLQKSELI